ncbi:MAG: response regulator transcription factor, partial [Chitinophagaceae bacterium]|nr:response regulator transcription factor [Chitinophagaceae bacterium]
MSKLTCIIVEDEPLATKVLVDYIRQVPYLQLLETFKDAIPAGDFLRSNQPDIMFLDIHLPGIKGIDFLKTLPNRPAVILTTAYHQYAVEGFNLNVTDYLLKPFEFERFLAAVSKVKVETRKQDEKDFIFVNVQKKKVKIAFDEILYVESQREYIKIVTTKREFLSKLSTNEIESMLPPGIFKRIHRSFIVSIKKIDSYNAEMIDVGGVQIPIGRGYRDIV